MKMTVEVTTVIWIHGNQRQKRLLVTYNWRMRYAYNNWAAWQEMPQDVNVKSKSKFVMGKAAFIKE